MSDRDRIRDALYFIPAANRETWVRTGMAVKSELGDAGFEVWDAWSQQADSYNAKDARDVWKSVRGNGKVTAGTLFHEAKANGWRDDAPEAYPGRTRSTARPSCRTDREGGGRKAGPARSRGGAGGGDPCSRDWGPSDPSLHHQERGSLRPAGEAWAVAATRVDKCAAGPDLRWRRARVVNRGDQRRR
jgi:hypothetical protein